MPLLSDSDAKTIRPSGTLPESTGLHKLLMDASEQRILAHDVAASAVATNPLPAAPAMTPAPAGHA